MLSECRLHCRNEGLALLSYMRLMQVRVLLHLMARSLLHQKRAIQACLGVVFENGVQHRELSAATADSQ